MPFPVLLFVVVVAWLLGLRFLLVTFLAHGDATAFGGGSLPHHRLRLCPSTSVNDARDIVRHTKELIKQSWIMLHEVDVHRANNRRIS